MSERGGGVLPVSELVGRTVLSLSTGNKLGTVSDVFLDALSSKIFGFTINASDGSSKALLFSSVHSFGHDAIMAAADDSITPTDDATFSNNPNIRQLSGTKVITASGTLIGHIAEIYVTIGDEPFVFFDVRVSLLDTLLGRRRYIPASTGHALSDDRERLIVPDEAVESFAHSIEELISGPVPVQSFAPTRDRDDTLVVLPDDDEDEDETIVRPGDDDETVVHTDGDDDEKTVLRFRGRG